MIQSVTIEIDGRKATADKVWASKWPTFAKFLNRDYPIEPMPSRPGLRYIPSHELDAALCVLRDHEAEIVEIRKIAEEEEPDAVW